jgi:flagellar hook-basal body complex protein FliE
MSSVSFPAYSALTPSKVGQSDTSAAARGTENKGAEAVEKGVSGFREAVEAAETAALETAVQGADPHAMVDAMAKAEIALSSAVTIRDKVVEAYNELLRMPV